MPRTKLPAEEQPNITPEKLSDQVCKLKHLFEINTKPRYDRSDPEAIAKEIDDFFEYCVENSLRPGVELMCAYLGIDRATLHNWQNGGGRRAEVVKGAKQLLAALLEQWGAEGSINPTTLIWWQKNHQGYQDVVTLEARQATGLDSLPTKKEILSRLPEDDEEIPMIEEWSEGDAGEEG